MKKVYFTIMASIIMFSMSFAQLSTGYCWNSYSNCLTNADIKEFFGIYDEVEWLLAYHECAGSYANCVQNQDTGLD